MTKQLVIKLFDYKDGWLYWKNPKSDKMKSGDKAGCVTNYTRISFKGKKYLAHRLVFLWHYGYLPITVNHINGDKNDNRIENLREATYSQNLMNKGKHKGSRPYKGVRKQNQKWSATLTRVYLGSFETAAEAALAYNAAAMKKYGKFAKLNEVP